MEYLFSAIGLALAVGLILKTVEAPHVGLLLLAPLAPVSELAVVGSLKIVHVLATVVLGAIGARWVLVGRRYSVRILTHVGIMVTLIAWASAMSAENGGRFFVVTLGAVALVVAVMLTFAETEAMVPWLAAFAISVIAMNLVSLILVYQMPLLRPILLDVSSGGARLRGTLDNPNFFGGAQILVLGICAYALVNRVGPRTVWLGGVGVSFGCILLAQSRSALVGCLFGTGVLLLLLAGSSRQRMRIVMWGGVVVGAMLLVYLNLPAQVGDVRLARVAEEGSNVTFYDIGRTNLDEGRLAVYGAAIETIIIHPWGLGYGSHQRAVMGEVAGVARMPHNSTLKNLFNYGVVGGVYVTVLWWLPVMLGFRRAGRRGMSRNALAPYLVGSMAGYLLHSQMHSMTEWVYLFMFWGFCMRALELERPYGALGGPRIARLERIHSHGG